MAQGAAIDLVWIALWTGALGFWIAVRNLPFTLALLISILKVAIPFVYFAWYFDGTWTHADDKVYLEISSLILDYGYNPVSALTQEEALYYLFSSSEGVHILYSWWNILAQWLFGHHYYSAVFMNVLLTFVAANFLYGIARISGLSRGYAMGLLLFFLVHWDVVAWSSVLNLKDIAVMTLTVMSFYYFLHVYKGITVLGILAFAAVTASMFWLRFFVPVLILFATALWLVQKRGAWTKYVLLTGAAIGVTVVIETVGLIDILEILKNLDYQNFVFGGLRWILTPQPWSVELNYSFLLVPSVIHWVMLIPTLVGAAILWRDSRYARLILTYLVILTVFYALGAIEFGQGPRQRVQITFAIVWAQFHFIWVAMRNSSFPGKVVSPHKIQPVEAVG